LEDPKGKPVEKVREIRDEIERRVKQLFVQPTAAGSCPIENCSKNTQRIIVVRRFSWELFGNVFIYLEVIGINTSMCAGVAEHGQRRRLQEPILQRFVGSNPTPCTIFLAALSWFFDLVMGFFVSFNRYG
jgi:hypothetical protein